MNKEEFFIIAEKYNGGSCSQEEMDIIASFCEKLQLSEISADWSLSEEERIRIGLMKKITASIHEFESNEKSKTQYQFGFMGNAWKVAAAIALILGISFTFYLLQEKAGWFQQEQLSVEQIIKENPKGVKSHVRLPDGTHVWLNAASSISYSPGFTDTERVVNLNGEAYFEVVKDKTRPFKVVSDQIVTTALGTSFNINAYKKENIRVSLSTGKVDVSRKDNNQNVILLPGQQADVNGSELLVTLFENVKVLSWKDGTIYFDKTDFDEMISVLEKWYDVEFKIENLTLAEKESLKVTGTFKNLSLEKVLDFLGYSLKFDYAINKKVIAIKF